MAGRCNDNLGVWFYGTRLKCALIRMVLVIKYDAKGFLPKEKNICGREFPQSPRHDNSCLPKDQIIPLSHSGAFPWSAGSSPAKWSSEGRSILWRWRRGGVWLWWRSGSYGFRFWRKRFRTRMDTEWNSTASVQVCLVTRGKLICLFLSCDLAYRSTVGLELLNYG